MYRNAKSTDEKIRKQRQSRLPTYSDGAKIHHLLRMLHVRNIQGGSRRPIPGNARKPVAGLRQFSRRQQHTLMGLSHQPQHLPHTKAKETHQDRTARHLSRSVQRHDTRRPQQRPSTSANNTPRALRPSNHTPLARRYDLRRNRRHCRNIRESPQRKAHENTPETYITQLQLLKDQRYGRNKSTSRPNGQNEKQPRQLRDNQHPPDAHRNKRAL